MPMGPTQVLPIAAICGALGLGAAAVGQEKAGAESEPAAEDAPDEIVVGEVRSLEFE
jgi:hypothetical protein